MCTLNPVRLFVTMWTVAHQASLSMESFQARIMKYVVISYSREFLDPGIESASLLSPALADGFFTTGATWEALKRLKFG